MAVKLEKEKHEQSDAWIGFARFRSSLWAPLADSKATFNGPSSNRKTAVGSSRTSRFASFHSTLYGGWPRSRRGACCFGLGLLHLCLGPESGATAVLDGISVDDDVRLGPGAATQYRGDLHTTGGLP